MTGGWAATNTLREACHQLALEYGESDADVIDARVALALVETALDAAEAIAKHHGKPLGWVVQDDDLAALAAALRAVREGAERGCAACEGDPEAHGLHVCGEGA